VLEDLLHLAGSGRTSIPADPAIDPALYRTAGYRACGTRAVRVDILERLADLIRPSLAWREGAPGARPAGAFGGVFTVVNAMTSLIGASGEDFASILRSLGYRMERRPKPPETQPEPPALNETPALIETFASSETAASVESAHTPPAADLPVTEQAAPASGAAESSVHHAAEIEPPAMPVVEETAGPDRGEVPPATEEMIEVWRPGRAGDRHRGRARARARAKPVRAEPAAATSTLSAESGAPAIAEANAAPAVTEPDRQKDAHRRPHRPARQRRKPEHRMDRQDRDGREGHKPRERPGKRFEAREKMPDPNSPFAKLAALKAQLEADAKERPKERG